jgi:hypothetical protein
MPLNFDELIRNSAMSRYRDGNAEPLINLLRSDRKLTPELRSFVADILEGKIKKRRGRRRGLGFEKAGVRVLYKMELEITMLMLKAINSHEPKRGFDAYREALEIVAERYKMTADQLDKIIYLRKRKRSSNN